MKSLFSDFSNSLIYSFLILRILLLDCVNYQQIEKLIIQETDDVWYLYIQSILLQDRPTELSMIIDW